MTKNATRSAPNAVSLEGFVYARVLAQDGLLGVSKLPWHSREARAGEHRPLRLLKCEGASLRERILSAPTR